jgi:hypothetical protein
MTVFEVADRLIHLCTKRKFVEAGEELWADNVVSIEPMQGDMARLEGRAAVRAKGEWWVGAHDIHSCTMGEPYFNGDSFVVRYQIDVTDKATGERRMLDEFGLYRVEGGKIAEEVFLVPQAYFQHR